MAVGSRRVVEERLSRLPHAHAAVLATLDSVISDQSTEDPPGHRRSLWDYYDRRVTDRPPGLANAHAYWSGLGVKVAITEIESEALQLERRLRALDPMRFVELGAGPGTFTGFLPGQGIAIDQSQRALSRLRAHVANVPVLRADALRLPLQDNAVPRCFTSHLYGLLLPTERSAFLAETRRVSDELVILDAGRPQGVSAEEWQERTLPDGGQYRVFRRHFDAEVLAGEVRGEILFDGRFYVMVVAHSNTAGV